MYLIDGHNLIAQLPDLSLDDPHDEAKLVERLKSAMAHLGQRCVVIFDSGLPGGLSRDLSTGSVQAIFAHSGTSADAILLERINEARDPASVTLVSADQAVTAAATRRRMPVLSPAAFIALMTPRRTSPPEKREPHLSPHEIDEWLALFGGELDDDADSP